MIPIDELGVEPTETQALRPDLIRVPVPTETLPPATHTNSYLLAHDGKWLLVDVGGDGSDASLEPLFDALIHYCDGALHSVLITHEHLDHHVSLSALVERYPNVHVYAHPHVIERASSLHPRVDWYPARDADELFGLQLLLTEGHARGHLSAVGHGFVLCADMMSGLGTIVVAPPDGNMVDYFASLERLAELGDLVCLPSHGGASSSVRERALDYLAHRQERERKIRGSLSPTEGQTSLEVTTRAYDDVPEFLHAIAEKSCLAHLEKLREEGRAVFDGMLWRRV